MRLLNEHCSNCGKEIKPGDPVVEIKTGKARKGQIRRALYGLFSSRFAMGIGWMHVDCIEEIDYYFNNPQITASKLEHRMEKAKGESQ